MERRKDYRHALRYNVSMKCPRTKRVLDDVATEDVSASGMRFRAGVPHGLKVGDIIEVQLVAQVAGRAADDTLTMATRGTIVWLRDREGAIRFDAPLAY